VTFFQPNKGKMYEMKQALDNTHQDVYDKLRLSSFYGCRTTAAEKPNSVNNL